MTSNEAACTILAATALLSACATAEVTPSSVAFACPTPLPPVVRSQSDPIIEPADYPTLLQLRTFWDHTFQHGSNAQLATLIRDGDLAGRYPYPVDRSWWLEAKELYDWRLANNCPDVPNVLPAY